MTASRRGRRASPLSPTPVGERLGEGEKHARAFTLLEVMVAIGILAFALLSVSDIVSSSLRSQVLARDLEVATLLGRGKMAELTERYEREGFSLGGDEDEGSFEDEGHPEFKWRAKVVEPEGTLDGKGLAKIFLGGGSLEDLLGPKADADGRQQVNPAAAGMAALVEQQLNAFAQSVKKGVRELRLTVAWKEGARDESFTVVTHLVVLQPAGGTP
ncbi:MAG TPA: type II secretion system protein [Anaeromyxobacteraceae bacterium]|nr:type II secretion system protein [Anaeromyxobacteraceae bacterium]